MLGALFNPSIIYNNNFWQKYITTTKQQMNTFRAILLSLVLLPLISQSFAQMLQQPLSWFLSQPFHPPPAHPSASIFLKYQLACVTLWLEISKWLPMTLRL